MTEGWGKPDFGAGVLRYPQIMSPNFNLANPSASPANSWALLQSGLAYIFGLVLSGGTITGPDYVINTSGIFIYSGTPANGNLIGSWAGVAGTDGFGNAYSQGFNVTMGAISGTVFSGTNFVLNTNGLFLYNGTPGLGTLVVALTQNVTQDAFGNEFDPGLTVGKWNNLGQPLNNVTLSVRSTGLHGFLVSSSSGALVANIDPTTGALLVYNSSGAGLGNLTSSVAPTSGTDSSGNAFLSGVTSYFHDVAHTQYVACQHTDNGLDFLSSTTEAGPWTSTGNSITSTVLGLFIDGNGTDGITMAPSGAPLIVQGLLQVTSTSEFGDAMLLDPVGSPATPGSGVKVFSNTSGILAARGGDGNVYLTGRRTIYFTGTQTVSSATFVTVTDGTNNFSATVAAAAYKFRAMLVYKPSGTTGNATWELASPAASSCGATFTFWYNGQTSGVSRYDNTSGFGSAQVGPLNSAITAAVFCTLIVEGTAVFSASGVFSIKAETNSGSNFVIQQGSYFELEPL
jgi:hypothetical protein